MPILVSLVIDCDWLRSVSFGRAHAPLRIRSPMCVSDTYRTCCRKGVWHVNISVRARVLFLFAWQTEVW